MKTLAANGIVIKPQKRASGREFFGQQAANSEQRPADEADENPRGKAQLDDGLARVSAIPSLLHL